ncbi:unnamed protein product [Onchocerca ochengi]|uniref:Coiled-coil domain-containing protein 39 n=1 Tax=Onchocerca ochengi TaxID=42157 RepID=A0A182E0N1_ONCOC|nr:unnamed protein product [Onchocerca ochengi]
MSHFTRKAFFNNKIFETFQTWKIFGSDLQYFDEKLHIKALNLKISSLEAEKTVLKAQNNELESRLIHLDKNISAASIIAPSTHGAVEASSNLISTGSAFKSIPTQMMVQIGKITERQTGTEALQWSISENVATVQGYYEKMVNEMRIELDAVREECSLVQEKIVQMGCVNFELEEQLKDAKEKLENAEIRVRQAKEQAGEARRNCAQQKKYQKSLQSEFLTKFNVAEKEINNLKEELDLKNEQLKARTIENNKLNEEMKQWRFAVDEMEAVHMEIQMLEKQLNNEKAAMESKWDEVRTILLERKGDISRKTSEESITDGEQNAVNQLRQMMNTVNDLKNTINEQAKQLELDKTQRRKFKAVIRQLQSDKEALLASSTMKNNNDREQHMIQYETQLAALQRQRDFMDQEMTLLCTLNNSKDVLIQALQSKLEDICSEKSELSHLRSENDKNEDKNGRIDQLQAQIEIMDQEKSEALNLLAKRDVELQEVQMHTQRLQVECDQLQLQLQFLTAQNLDAMPTSVNTHQHIQLQHAQQQMEIVNSEREDLLMAEKLTDGSESVILELRAQIGKFASALQQKNTELQKVLNENETLKMKCVESTAALDLLSSEMERRSQEKDDIIEMLQSQHTYLTQTILLNEKSERQSTIFPTVSQSTNVDAELKCMVQDASTIMDEAANDLISVVRHHEMQTMTDFHLSEAIEAKQEQSSESLCKVIRDDHSVEPENHKICQCLNESNQMHDNSTDEIKQLMILNAELETAVEVLKGEIWTLNKQLKERSIDNSGNFKSLVDREGLSEKLCEFSQRHENELERARERERDLEEQKDMAERSQRQAALAENESNRRLVEWQEKSAQMENSRIELENSYMKLSKYYQQLQQAYNALYARLNAVKIDSNTQTVIDNNYFKINEEITKKVEYLKNELEQRKTELKDQTTELQHIRDLLRKHLHITLKNVRNLRETNLKFLKDFITDNVQTFQAELQEALEEVHSYIEKVIIKWFKEKELKDAEVSIAVQQLMNDILTENISEVQDLSLSVIVDAVSKKFSQRESENTALKNKLWDERSDKIAFEMKMQQSISEREKESELKVKELENLLQPDSMTDRSSPAAAKSGSDSWNCSTPCTICRELRQTKQPASTLQLQLAILAARLTTKIADNDALFRGNAELAETNQRLQNEIDELREQMTKHITSSDNTGISATSQQPVFEQWHIPEQSLSQSPEQKAIYAEDKERNEAKDFDAMLVSSSEFQGASQQPSLNQQIIGYTTTNETQTSSLRELEFQKQDAESLKKKLNAIQKYNSESEEKSEEIQNNAEKLGKCLEVLEEYCLDLENKVEQLKDGSTTEQCEDAKHHRKLEKESTKGLKEQKDVVKGKSEEDKYEVKEIDCISNGTWISFDEQVQGILQNDTIQDERIQLSQELEGQLQQKEIKMQELEKENRFLSQKLKSQQQLIEGLEKKLDMTEEYSMTLEVKNVNIEEEILEQKKNYEELMIEKEDLMTKLKHTQEGNIQMQRQLGDYNTQMSEIQRKNEIDQELRQQLIEAQEKIAELERKLDQMVVQNELLKNGEQKLIDALMISNEELAKIESKNERLESEISNLQTSLLKTKEMAKETDNTEKSMTGNMNAVIEVNSKAGTSSTTVFDSPVIIEDCYPIQKKDTLCDKALVQESVQEMQTNLSALKKKKKHLPADKRTNPMSNANTTASSAANSRESNETAKNLSSKAREEKILSFVDSFEPALQRTIYDFHQNDDKLRRRKTGVGGLQDAEKM